MPVALEQFVKQLADSGVIAPGKLENFIPPKASPKDAQELARQLVQSKQLTKFQVQEIYQGRARSLILGNYTILDKIGAGGMGQVFKAEHRRMHRTVAIKILPKSAVESAAGIARFQREAEAAARLTHPNIVAAYDADEANGIHFLAMEYVEGSDLSALVKKNGPLSVGKAVHYILQAARGLEFAHGEHVVHRDIKPANLLLDKKGTVKILDLGLARIETGPGAAAQAELTGSGAVIGTVDYMAPEQGISTKVAGARADIYSLGCTLHYLLIGKPIYDGDTVTAKLLAHHRQPVPDLCRLQDDVPEQLQLIFSRMVAKKIEDRYQTMSDVVTALEALEASISGLQRSASVLDSADTIPDADALSFLGDIPAGKSHKPKTTKNQVSRSAAESPPGSAADSAADSAAGPVPEKRGRGNKKKLLLGMVVAAGLALAMLTILLVLFRSEAGTLIVRINRPNVAVQVLDQEGKVEFSESGVDGKISIAVDSGKHQLTVEKVGFQTFTQDFSMASGGSVSIQAALEPIAWDDAWGSPAFKKWMKDVAGLPAEKQAEAVAKELQENNPGFDGKEAQKVENGVVTELHVVSDQLTDISPVRALVGLQLLDCAGTNDGNRWNGSLSDLSPLKGLPLTFLNCGSTQVRSLSPLQGMKLTTVLTPFTHVSDLSPLAGMPLKTLNCAVTSVSSLLPLRGMHLTDLDCASSYVSDLSPLRGMPLVRLDCGDTNITDLAPLRGMHLTSLSCANTQVSDLSPLTGMPLTMLGCSGTTVSDLSPLEGMPLAELYCDRTQVSDLSSLRGMSLKDLTLTPKNITKGIEIVRQMKSLEKIGIARDRDLLASEEFWKRFDSGEFNAWDKNPASMKWMKDVAALPAEEQVRAVAQKLQELNPRFDGHESHKVENGVVTELTVWSDQVTDVMPVRALTGLTVLDCGSCAMTDLSALKGMPLTELSFWNTKVSDVSSLAGMPLSKVGFGNTPVSDLSPLKGMRLTGLWCPNTHVSDLSPLQGMPLALLDCTNTQVSDLAPLQGMPLTELNCDQTRVSVLSPLKGMPLVELNCAQTQVTDLSPLKGTHLTKFVCSETQVSDLAPLQGMSLTFLNCADTRVTDLAPLTGMPLTFVRCSGTGVSDLSPLKGMPLTELHCARTMVSDLSPLRDMKLTTLHCDDSNVSDLSPLKGMGLKELNITPKSIVKGMDVIRQMSGIEKIGNGLIGQFPTGEFWTRYDAGEFNPWDTNVAFKKWVKDTQALPVENQVQAVVGKLRNLNLYFDGKETHKIENGLVTELHFSSDQVTDISPMRGLASLRGLYCRGGSPGSGRLSDLSPLRGMPLTGLKCGWSQVSDLSPLNGMHLTYLDCGGTQVHDLSPLRGMPLTGLWCSGAPVGDLSPLAGMPLANLYCDQTSVSDLSPLKGMSLEVVTFTPKNIAKGIDVIRQMKSLGRIGIGWQPQDIFPPEEFWKKYDAGEFKQ